MTPNGHRSVRNGHRSVRNLNIRGLFHRRGPMKGVQRDGPRILGHRAAISGLSERRCVDARGPEVQPRQPADRGPLDARTGGERGQPGATPLLHPRAVTGRPALTVALGGGRRRAVTQTCVPTRGKFHLDNQYRAKFWTTPSEIFRSRYLVTCDAVSPGLCTPYGDVTSRDRCYKPLEALLRAGSVSRCAVDQFAGATGWQGADLPAAGLNTIGMVPGVDAAIPIAHGAPHA